MWTVPRGCADDAAAGQRESAAKEQKWNVKNLVQKRSAVAGVADCKRRGKWQLDSLQSRPVQSWWREVGTGEYHFQVHCRGGLPTFMPPFKTM
ncbi:unnamed protein product [Protopolystoma xenopodis]|uniref:Uncharacterized protein n=1 Tax=Protopolystoma xenopodis TaxID=117903 RepID=A0A448WPK9_9PLAT|nr:unnamed protein product [Protopolystoma xenopodis]